MRKIFLLLAVLPLVFIGCDDEENTNPLNGTSWRAFKTQPGYDAESVISFEASNFSCTNKKFFAGADSLNTDTTKTGTYTYANPNIVLTSDSESISGTLVANKMTLIIPANSDTIPADTLVYLKW